VNQPNPELIPGNARVFVACLLSFAILIAPIAAIATPRTRINPTANEKNSVPAERKEATEASLALDPAPAAVPEPAPAPPPAAPVIVATLTDNRPSVDPASAKPGDTINYTVTIQNTGDADATGVQFNQNIDTHSLYVTNSGLLVMADSYNTIGGVNINVPAPGLLTNDLDISAGTNAGMTTTAQTVSSTQCAACNNVTINGDGSFTYDPKAGFTGTDTFTYAAKNAANKTAMATVQVTVAGKIWFIKNSGAAGGACGSSCDGRLSHPFQTLAAFNTANGSVGGPAAGDSVFIFESTTDYTGPVIFLNNQKFVGQDATASLISITGLTQPSGTDPLPAMNFTPATNVNITSASSAITLGQGNTLRGFTVGTTTGTKIVGNNFGTLIVGNSATPDVTLNGAGQALNLTTGTLSVTGGFVSVTSTSSTAQGINLAGIADSDGAGGNSFSFGATTVSGSTTQGILIGTTTADLNFGNTSVTGGTDAISFQNNSAGTRTFGTLAATAGGTAIAINHVAGGGNVTVTGLATLTSNAGNTIDIQTQAVSTTVNFAGGATLTKTAGGTGINLVNDNGTVTFGGTLTIGTSGARFPATAVTISGGAGPTFSTGIVNLGTVSIFTNAFAGITSTNNDGTINSTSGTVDTGAATALSIDGPAGLTTLGMTLTTVNSTGGTNNISLIDDGGTLTVNGGAMSGATVASFSVNAGTVSATYSGNISQANAAAMVNISGAHNTGTITFNTGTLSATNGTGLQFDNADGNYNFNGTTTLTGGSRIDILNGSSGSFGFSSGASVTNGGGTASFNVSDSNPGVAYAGTITTNALRPVSISNAAAAACGTQTFSGAIGSTGNGILVNNCNAGTITFSAAKTLNTATNSAVTLTTNAGATINFTNGGLNIDTTTAIGFNATGGGIINVTGSTNDIDSATATALLLNGVTVGGSSMAFNTVNKTGTGGGVEGINIDGLLNTGGGTLTVASSTIAGTLATSGKAGIDIATSSAPITFTTVAINATDGHGIALTNNTAAIAVNGGTVGATTSTTGNAVDIDQGTANITVAAALTKSTGGRIVEITGRTGTSTIDITGSLTCSSTCTGINVQNINAGTSTINFSSGTKNLDTSGGAGAGVTLDNIDNATVNFSNGGLNIDTASGIGFNAINGATAINVTGSGNTINSTSATALNVSGSTIGANNLNFHDISSGNNTAAADPANGIVLNNTGSGRLIVAGDGNTTLGGNSSGGVIQHTTSHGILLTTTQNPSFVNMSIHDGGGNGIYGTSGVVSFTFDNGQVTNTGTTGADQYTQNGIAFVDPGVAANTISGTVVITDSLFSGIRRNAIMIETWNGTISSLNISNNTLSGPSLAAALKDSTLATTNVVADAIHVFSQGNATQTANLTTGTINNNTISNFEFPTAGVFSDGGNGIQVAGGSGSATNLATGTLGTAANPIEIANNDIDNVAKNSIIVSFNGQQGISNFNIHNNGTVANPMSNAEGLGISVFFGGSGTFSALVNNNAIDNNGPTINAGSAGIGVQLDDGPAGLTTAAGSAAITVNGNTVTNPDGFGIRGIVRNSLGTLNLKIQNNNVGTPSATNREAIRVDSGSGAGDTTLCLNISGNSGPLASTTDLLVGSGIDAGIGVRKQGTVAGTNEFNLQNISPANPTNAQVQAFVGMPVPPGLNFAATAGGGAGTNANGNGVDIISGSNYGTCTTAAQFRLEKPTDVFVASTAKPESSNADTPFVTESADSLLAFANVKVDHAEILNDFNRSLTIHSYAVDANVGQQTLLAKARVEASIGQQPVLVNARVEANAGQQPVPVLLNARVEGTIGQRAPLANVRVEAERGPAPAVPPSLIARAAASLSRVANSFDSLIVPSAHAEESEGSKQKSASSKRSDVRLNHARSVRTNRAATASNALAPMPVGCSASPGTICVNVGILHPGDSVQIGFSVTVNNPPNLTLLTPSPHISTQGAISGGNFATVQTNDPDTVAAGDPTDTPIDLFDVNVALGSSLNPSTPTDAVTYTATITVPAQVPAPLGGVNPSSGTVTFKDNNATISVACTNVALSGSGPWTAQCTVPAGTYTGATSHPITATYNGNGNFDQNTSNTLTQVVLACTTTVTVTNVGDNGGVDPAFGAGTGTLRQAIVDVCPGGTINFNIPGGGPDTITLSAGLVLSKDVTINGPTNKTTIVNGGGTNRVFTVNSGKTVNVSDLTLTNGFSAGNGGAILNDHGTLTLTNMTISGSTASLGGGIYNNGNAGTASLTITSSTLSGNTATTNGGAIYSDGLGAGTGIIVLKNSTISGNKANGQGGGILILGSTASSTLTTTNVTIASNTADFDDTSASDNGGGLFVGSGPVVTLRNTIVASNFRGTASPVADDIQGTVDNTAASLNNLIGTGGSGGLVNGSFGNQVGVASPGLVSLNNNGGPTQTQALLLTSPAVEAGDNTTATNAGLTTDQRGATFPRIADSADPNTTATVDIGAFELHPSVEDITDKSTPEDTPFNFNFNIGDGTGGLIASVTASSNNAALVPTANLVVTGAGSTRNLAITPVTNANTPSNGTATITVTVTATNGRIQQDDFILTVTEVNDAPVPVNDTVSNIDEDSGVYSIPIAPLLANDAKGPLNEAGQTLSITGVSNFTGGTAVVNGANIDFTPTLNFNGAAGFDYTAQDDGTTNALPDPKSANGHVSFNINPINDAPSFTKGGDQTANKNAGAQTVTNWATAISAGPPDEVTAGQTVSFNVSVTGTTGSLAFTSPPAVSSSGTLTYTATNATSGTATVDVKAVDSGSGVAPNQNESAVQTFTITVTGVNVAPVNTVPATVSIPQDTVYTFTGAAISVADVDAAETDNVISVALTATNGTMNLSGTAGLTFTGGSDGSAAMTVEGTIPNLNAALNNMRFTPTPGYTGAASLQMVSNDLGKTGTGGPQSDDDTINITVTAGAAMYINEVLFNPPGTDAPNEYIEIRGAANTTIPVGTYLVAIEGDAADNPGDVQTIINLSGLSFGSNGFLVLLQNGNTYTTDAGATVLTSTTLGFGGLPGAIFQADAGATDIEDASVTFMLIQAGAAPTLTDDIDVNDDGLTDGFVFAGWNVRDSISAMNGTANARAYGAFSFRNSAGTGTSVGPEVIVNFIPSYVGRNGDSTGSTAADWVASGVLGGAAPNWTLGVAAETEPASFAGKPLNHIGASNFTNLAPVNSVPAATQNVNEDFVLTFNAGNANLISISDPDAGVADVKVTLTATNGTMSLSGTAGLTFTPAGANNDGVNDTQMIFTGTIANINTALNGMTFTPTLDYFGGATIQIVTDDQGNVGVGGAKTDTDTVNINVNAVNDPPSFVIPPNAAAVDEDAGGQTVNGFASSISQGPGESGQTPLTFNLSPAGTTGNITFASGPAIDATTGNLTYTTNADTNGTATFNVTLSDSGSNVAPNSNTSGTQQFTITVNAVNDAPSFLIPSSPPSVNEDAGAQTVNSFTTNFQPGPPAATDEVGQILVGYTLTQTGTTGNLTFTSAPSISNAGTLTYTPTGDTSGTATFNVVATDNGSGSAPNVNQSAPVAFTITVTGQNDAPVMDNTGNMSLAAINEDVPNASNPGTLVSDVILSAGGDRITDVDAGAVEGIAVIAVDNTNGTWQYSIDNGTNWLPFGTPDSLNSRLLAANANTRVRFIPNLNFNGTVDPGLTFRAWDQTSGTNGNTADTSAPGGISAFSTATETASITVNPDNDTPTTTGIPPVTVNEDAANTVLNLRLSFNDVEDGNDLAYTVQANTNPSLFSSVSINNANDNLTLAYTANAFGSAQITVRGTDVGGLFVESTFTVTVNSSNDPPTFTKGPNLTTFQNSGPQTVTNWATNMSPGPADESGQTLTFNVTGNTNAALFSAPPAINATTGTLTYTGANNANGNATITITLSDNGGILNGGNDTSAPQTFDITITPCVNPATVINTNDSGAGSLREAITNVCTGGTINFDAALNGQTITLTSGELAISKNLTINGPGANLLTISGNNASRIFNIQTGMTAAISGLTVSNGNSASDGGGIVNQGTLTLSASAITNSSSTGSGGGMVNVGGSTMTISGSTLTGNTAPIGAGVANGGGLTILNSTISANNGRGFTNSAGTATIINSTISGNTDAGIEAVVAVSIGNSIVANAQNNSPDVDGTFTSQGNNLIGDKGSSTGFTNGVNGDHVGTGGALVNPLLGPLANNGGPTQTHALLPGSPAINAGSNTLANNATLTTDQRGAGFARIVNTTVDIGAFESRGFTIAITSGNLQSAVFNTAFGAPLVATVSSGAGEPVSGGQVVFTAPGSGASATFTGGVTTIASAINAGGQASAAATANATVGGPYNVTATGNGITGTANFSLTNIKANQTINFAALANKTFGDPDFGISATATSGLPVSFAPSGNCTVSSPSPGTVHITGAGSCTITASRAGDANYNAAADVPRSFTIAKAATNTAVSSTVNPSDLNQSVTFTATVTSGAGTPTGTVQFKDNATNLGAPVALNASGVAQLTTSALTTGTHTITADYSGDANFLTSAGTLSGGQVVKAQPSLSINDVSVTEGNAGTKVLSFTVTLSAASNLTVSVDYATANGTATAPSDYTAIPSTLLTFNPGDTSKTVSVTINGDVSFEPDETFFLNLSNPVNATISDNQGLGTIQNDDALGGFISFSQPNYNVSESTGIVTVTVTRTNDVSQAAQVDYATDDTGASISCAALNTGLASQRCDYTSMFGTLKFAANETQKTVDIPINLDAYTEGPEVFTFNLSNPTGGAVLIASTATVTISDSPSPTPNATDDTASFVRQLYHDFLNRDADAAGLAFWKNNIDKCNDPAQRPAGQTLAACIEVQRITTIAAFFLSIEFKQTGGMVRDFYVAALDRPLTNNMPGFVEFMRDTQAIQKGVTVGQGNWPQVLDANRLAFMNEFVMRAEFVALYPTTDTPTQYVDKLYQHANLTQTQQERLDAIEYFGGAATAADPGARARALLLLTQNGNFQVRETRRAFVHMQYLGYLRRDPNAAPDNNFDGFNFWVTKLNQFNGDYLQAEMVKAFLTSLEYRRRFGP